VSQQLADIDRRLRALNRPVEQEAPAPGPRKRQGSKTAAGMKAAVESREAAAKRAQATTGEATVETNEAPSAAEAVIAHISMASDPTAVIEAGAGSAEGVTAKARASKAKASKPKASKAKVSKATPAKASESLKSSARAQKAESHRPGSGSETANAGTERDAGNNPKGKA
jgi:hypothetical protein